MAMRAFIFVYLCDVSAGLEARKPADLSDLRAVADFASSAADLFLDAAKALPSPAEAEAALAAQDEKEMDVMLAADAAERDSHIGSASSFLSVPSMDASVTNIRFVEPADTVGHFATVAQESLDAALHALEERQRSAEDHVAAAFGSIRSSVRH